MAQPAIGLGKPLFLSLPLDVKILILENLDSYDDLISLTITCKDTYQVSRLGGQLWKKIQYSALRSEYTPALRALAHIKRCSQLPGAVQPTRTIPLKINPNWHDQFVPSNLFAGPLTLLPSHMRETEENFVLEDVLHYRHVVRWFTRLFLNINYTLQANGEDITDSELKNARESPGRLQKEILQTELRRIETAFYILWFMMEQWYELVSPVDWVGDVIRLWTDHAVYRDLKPDLTVIMSAHTFLHQLLRPIIDAYVDSMSGDELTRTGKATNCISNYHRRGLPNIMLLSYSLDGIKDILCNPTQDASHTAVSKVYSYARINRGSYGDDQGLKCFTHAFDEMYWTYKKHINLHNRPLWSPAPPASPSTTSDEKSQGCVYQSDRSPWNQSEQFHSELTYWDDEKLLKWGFRHSSGVATSETRGATWSNVSLAMISEQRRCFECRDDWWCYRSIPKKLPRNDP